MKVTSRFDTDLFDLAAVTRMVQNKQSAQQTTPEDIAQKVAKAQKAALAQTSSYESLNVTGYSRPVFAPAAQGSPATPQQLSVAEALELIKKEGAEVDRSNMTDAEIVAEIENRFIKYIGREKYEAVYLFGILLYPEQNDVSGVINDEYDALMMQGWTPERYRNAYAEMQGYGGMTQGEMKSAIIQKYSEKDMTTYNFLAMLRELGRTGAVDNRIISDIGCSVVSSLNAQVREELVDAGFTLEEIFSLMADKMYASILKKMDKETTFQSIYDDLVYRMTDGGWMEESLQNTIHNFFKEILG